MAFNFPDPAEQQEVTNPITGSTYQWKNPPGKWVIVAKENAIVDIIYEGPNSPDPVGDYKLWYSTETLELYFYYTDANGNSAWVPTATPITMLEDLEEDVRVALEKSGVAVAAANANLRAIGLLDTALNDVENSLGKVTLQEVLDNGAVANKGMILRTSDPNIEGSSEYDAIEIIPAGARVMISAEDEAGWKPTLELLEVVKGNAGATRKAQIELDDNRLDINVESREDEIHFRFADEDKFCLKGMGGPSELKGKLIVDPGTHGNEVATYGQLVTIEEELEQLTPSIERGSWTWTTNENPAAGQYTTIADADEEGLQSCANTLQQCILDAAGDAAASSACNREFDKCEEKYKEGPSPDFSRTIKIVFNSKDSQGKTHTFETVEVGQIIDVFNDVDDSYVTGKIASISDTTITITPATSKGFASGLGRLKIFTINENVDLTSYVRKTGDTMTGDLLFEADAYETIGQTYPKIRFKAPDSTGENITDIKLWLDGSTYMRMNHSFRVDGSFKAAGVISAGQNLQYQGETRLGMSSSGGYLGKGTGTTKRALEFDENGKITRLQVNNGAGETGQVLVKTGDKKIQWASPQIDIATTPSPFMWYWEKKPGSEIANPKHFWWESGKFIYVSSTTATGMKLSKPDNLPQGAQRFGSYTSSSVGRTLKLWKQSSGGSWELMAWAVPYKYRFNFRGWCQIEYTYRQGSFPDITNSLWAISCPDLL